MKNKLTKDQIEHGLKRTNSGMGSMSINDLANLAANNSNATTYTTEADSAKTEPSARTPGTRTLSHRRRKSMKKIASTLLWLVIAALIATITILILTN